MEISLEDLECLKRERYRDAFRFIVRFRHVLPRLSRRDVNDVLRLAVVGRQIVDRYLEVVVWGEERVLRLR